MQARNFNIKERFDLWREQKRQIDRQKLMLDDGKFVFWHEFYQKAVEPAMCRHDIFENVYERDAWRISKSIRNLTATFNVEVERLPYSDVPEELKHYADEFVYKEAMMIANLISSDAFRAILGQKTKHRGITKAYWNKDINGIISRLKDEGLPAYYVGDIRIAMDLQPPLISKSRSGYYEFTSLLKGEGNIATEFWQNVNSLRDRSGLFPDKKPPRGNKPEDDESRLGVKIGGLAHNY